MVIVAVTGFAPAMKTLLPELKEQTGLPIVPVGADAIAQVRFTCPVKPPAGFMVMVELPAPPRLAIETAVPESAKVAGTEGALTVTARFVVATALLPSIAVMART